MSNLPPLPPGFTLDQQELPPLPPGFTLDGQESPAFKPQGAGWSAGIFPKVANAVVGQAEFDFPSAQTSDIGLSFGESFGPAKASVFGSDEDLAKAIQEKLPDAKFQQDKFGNAYFTTPDGKSFYVNKPGLDPTDVTRFAGKALSFVPAAKVASGLKSLTGRALGTGVAAGGTDLAMQKAAGREDADLGQSLLAAGLGTGVEFVAPIVGAAARKLKGLMDSGQKAEARRFAQELGIDDLSEEGLERLQKLAGSETRPQAAAGEAEFGFRYTRGTRTGDPRQLANEDRLGASPGPISDLAAANQRRTVEAVDELGERLVGRPLTDQQAAARDAQGRLIGAERALSSKVDEAYEAARGQNAFVRSDATTSLPDRIRQSLRDFDLELTPVTKRTLERIKDDVQKVSDSNALAVSLRAIDNQRRKVNNAFGSVKGDNKTDKRALTMLKNTLDEWLDESVDQALFSGSKDAIKALKQARALRAELGRKFQPKGDTGRVMKKLLDPDRTPEEVANYLIGASSVSPASGARLVAAYKEAVGDVNPLRELVFLRMVQDKATRTVGRDKLISNLKENIEGRGKSLMGELFTPNELSRISRFVSALEQFKLPREMGSAAGRSSGSPERLWRFGKDLLGKIPGLSHLFDVSGSLASRRALQIPFQPPQIPGALPALEATASQ